MSTARFGEARSPEARASPEGLPRAAGAIVEDGVSGRTGIGGARAWLGAEQPVYMIGSRSAELIEAGGPRAVGTGWTAAAETRTPDATKPLAGREASMDGQWSL